MRVALFVSALFAVSMTGGIALAHGPSGRVARPNYEKPVDVRQRPAGRDARPDARVARPAALQRADVRGGGGEVQSKARAQVAKPTNISPGGATVSQKRLKEMRSCAELGTACPIARSTVAAAGAGARAAAKADAADKQRSSAAERQRMTQTIKKVWQALCERNARACGGDAL